MKSEIIWTQEHHYRDMVTLADAQAEIDKFRIALDKSWERNLKQQAEITELVEIIEFGIEANKSSNPAEWHRWFEMAEKCLDKHRGMK